MQWSYSRLTAFEECRYRFYLKYLRNEADETNFYAEYGTLVHKILAELYQGKIKTTDCYSAFLEQFPLIEPHGVKADVCRNYYEDAKKYLLSVELPKEEIKGVEQEVVFNIGKIPLIGYIDLLLEDENGLVVVDNKTPVLRRNEKKKTVYNEKFERYLRQLYLYSIAVEQLYGEPPYKLRFNCFRNGTQPEEKFDREKQKKTAEWVMALTEEIKNCENWYPSPEWFKCKYICGFYAICDYAQTTFGK